MKKLFYLVLILNAGFFAWNFSQDEAPAPEVKTVADHKPSLVLLDEVKPAVSTNKKQKSKTKKEIPSKQASPAKTAAIKTPEPQIQTPHEQQDGKSTGEEHSAPETSEGSTVAENKKSRKTINCFELGSFPTMVVADKVSGVFRDAGIWAESRLHIEEQKQGHVIYIPTGGSYDKATGIIASVKQKGIQDYAILAVNGVRNTVVMGIYRTNTAAARRLEQLKGHGFNARMKPHIRKRPLYLVVFKESDNKPVPEGLWGRISHDYPKVNRAARTCE